MSTSPLQLIAEFQTKPDTSEEVERRVLEFLEKTRAEAGCVSAHFFRVNEEDDRFVFFAEFEGEEALLEHLDAEWRQALADIPEMLAEPPRRYTMRRVA